MTSLLDQARTIAPGLATALVIAAAATFLSEHYTAPVMLYALLLGMAFNFLTEQDRTRPGVEFAAKALLRTGVALLGMRIGWSQVTALGWGPVIMVLAMVAVTIGMSVLFAKAFGFNPLFGFLSGGATAICGASAALALSAALPAHEKKEQATLFTVIGVSALSTLAMITYPVIAHATGLSNHQAGIFIGATIHDVAQVVGAGYSMSRETGDIATFVKLMRVAMLVPVIVFAVMLTRARAEEAGTKRPPLLPWFAVAFAVLVAINSTGWLPEVVAKTGSELSRWCLVAAIAAIGMKTQLKELATVGVKPVLLMLAETTFLAVLVLALLRWAI